jgi:hypothetical protein
MSSLKSLLFDHSWTYTKRGGVAACHVVCIELHLKSVRVYVFWLVLWTTSRPQASACKTSTTRNQPHQTSNTQRTENKTTDVVIQQQSRKLLMMDILMSETC